MNLRELEQAATPGPWEVWDSCSWRRISTDRGEPVITPCNAPSDNHPDLLARREDLDLAVAARNALPVLLDLLEQAKCPNRLNRSIFGNLHGTCFAGNIKTLDGAKPCEWCAKRKEILGG